MTSNRNKTNENFFVTSKIRDCFTTFKYHGMSISGWSDRYKASWTDEDSEIGTLRHTHTHTHKHKHTHTQTHTNTNTHTHTMQNRWTELPSDRWT